MSIRFLPQRGFTFIELIVVVAIVGILASALVPLAQLQLRRQKESELRLALRTLRGAIDAYKRAYDEGRIEQRPDSSGYPNSLDELQQGVQEILSSGKAGSALASEHKPGKRIYFLRRIPRDPFGPSERTALDHWAQRSSASAPGVFDAGSDVFDVCSQSDARALDGSWYKDW